MATITITRSQLFKRGRNIRAAWTWHYEVEYPDLPQVRQDAQGNSFRVTSAGAGTLAEARAIAGMVNRQNGGNHTILLAWKGAVS
jgi:hypothetical protein